MMNQLGMHQSKVKYVPHMCCTNGSRTTTRTLLNADFQELPVHPYVVRHGTCWMSAHEYKLERFDLHLRFAFVLLIQ
jgi:hypothetical protein